MNFKCNHCDRTIDFRYFGDDKISCRCGAKYTKTVLVNIKDET